MAMATKKGEGDGMTAWPVCPVHGTEDGCADHLRLTMDLIMANESTLRLETWAAALPPDRHRLLEHNQLGPVTSMIWERMQDVAGQRYHLGRWAESFLEQPASAGCEHLTRDPTMWGRWYASHSGAWLCWPCSGRIQRPETCDGCDAVLDRYDRTTCWVLPDQYWPNRGVRWPPLLVVMSLCHRCEDDDQDDLDGQ